MKNNVLKIHEQDNVIVALQNLQKGSVILYDGIATTIQQDIPAKHKFFINDLLLNDEVIMYGVLVGKTQRWVSSGSLMLSCIIGM